MSRTQVLLENGLIVSVDLPEDPTIALVLCSTLLEDRCGPAGSLAAFAAELANRQLACVRFDYRGAGDATWAPFSWHSLTSDAAVATDFCRQLLPDVPVLLAGIGIGAVPAVMVHCSSEVSAGVVLIDADLLQGMTYAVSYAVPIRHGEFSFTESFLRDREQIAPRDILRRSPHPSLLICASGATSAVQAFRDLAECVTDTCFLAARTVTGDALSRAAAADRVQDFAAARWRCHGRA